MRRGKYTFPAALFLPGILTLNMTNVILNEVKNPRNKGRSGCIVIRIPGRVVFCGLHITDNIKSAGFAFPGDPSLRSG